MAGGLAVRGPGEVSRRAGRGGGGGGGGVATGSEGARLGRAAGTLGPARG